jgi:hypothetical protein
MIVSQNVPTTIENDAKKLNAIIARNFSLIIYAIFKVLMKYMLFLECGYCTWGQYFQQFYFDFAHLVRDVYS